MWKSWMFEERNFLIRRTLKRALRKPCPSRFSLSRENLLNIDYYHATLKCESKQGYNILVESVEDWGIEGLQWDGQSYANQISLSNKYLAQSDIEIIRFFRSAQTTYNSVKEFWVGEISLTTRRHLIKERAKQLFYNNYARFRTDRMFVLNKVIQSELSDCDGINYLEDNGISESSHEWFKLTYGERAFRHPKFEIEFKKNHMVT